MLFAVIREAAEAASANGPLQGYPPWLIVLVGALLAALLLWIFTKLLKIAMWIALVVVLGGGVVLAARMFLGH